MHKTLLDALKCYFNFYYSDSGILYYNSLCNWRTDVFTLGSAVGERFLLRQVLAYGRAPDVSVLAGVPTAGPEHRDCAGAGKGKAWAQYAAGGSAPLEACFWSVSHHVCIRQHLCARYRLIVSSSTFKKIIVKQAFRKAAKTMSTFLTYKILYNPRNNAIG